MTPKFCDGVSDQQFIFSKLILLHRNSLQVINQVMFCPQQAKSTS